MNEQYIVYNINKESTNHVNHIVDSVIKTGDINPILREYSTMLDFEFRGLSSNNIEEKRGKSNGSKKLL